VDHDNLWRNTGYSSKETGGKGLQDVPANRLTAPCRALLLSQSRCNGGGGEGGGEGGAMAAEVKVLMSAMVMAGAMAARWEPCVDVMCARDMQC